MATNVVSEILQRRVPQILGLYLAAGWGVLEFSDWLVNRYVLSPHLTDFGLVAWAAMIPTVLMLAWFHGAPGARRLTKLERIGIPTNFALAAALLLIIFMGRDLGAATTSVTLENEAGETVERVIPKTEFRRHLAIFHFDNESGDSALDWLQYGMPWALSEDLLQDLFLDVQAGGLEDNYQPGIAAKLKEAGFADGLAVPLALKREIAEDLHLDHLVTGSLASAGEQLAVTTRLYETRRGKLLKERSFVGTDPLEVVDRMSVQLRHDLEIPSQHVEETTDLPVSEMLTSSMPAFRSFVEGQRAIEVQDDWASAARHLEAAVAQDPTFADAHQLLALVYLLNDSPRAEEALRAALEHGYRLGERSEFDAKTSYYMLFEQDMEKALTVATMRSELFPDDVKSHFMLAILHSNQGRHEQAIFEYQQILELDPGQYDFLREIGAAYQNLGKFDEALTYYNRYAGQFPNDPRSFTQLGGLSRLQGEHEAAKRYYEKAALLEPDNTSVLITLADIEFDLGHFESAAAQLEEALALSDNPSQRMQAYLALKWYYEQRGQLREAIENMHHGWSAGEQGGPILDVLLAKLSSVGTYVTAGMTDAALDTVEAIEARMTPPFSLFVPLGLLEIALELEDVEMIEGALARFGPLNELFGAIGIYFSTYGQGRVQELRGEFGQAILTYYQVLEIDPTAVGVNTEIGRCHRKIGALQESDERLQSVLKLQPFNAHAHLEIARLYTQMGDHDRARAHYETALEVWRDPDPEFEPAQEARGELRALSSDS